MRPRTLRAGWGRYCGPSLHAGRENNSKCAQGIQDLEGPNQW